MSLVDYPSSDDDEPAAAAAEENQKKPENYIVEGPEFPIHGPKPKSPPASQPIMKPNQPSQSNEESSAPSIELPDASLLFDSPTSSSLFSSSDHNASRKRETNVVGSSLPRNKVPRSNLPHSKNVPDTSGSLLVPPQLTPGRSNVVTEDISKLFVKKSAKPS